MYTCNVIGTHLVKYEYKCNWEHYTAFYTVFYVNVFRSLGHVGNMEFDEIGQRVHELLKFCEKFQFLIVDCSLHKAQ